MDFIHKCSTSAGGAKKKWTLTRRVKKKKVCTSRVFFGLDPLLPPPPPSSAPTQTKGVPICSSLNSAFICILRLVKFKAREMLQAKRETKMLDGAVWI